MNRRSVARVQQPIPPRSLGSDITAIVVEPPGSHLIRSIVRRRETCETSRKRASEEKARLVSHGSMIRETLEFTNAHAFRDVSAARSMDPRVIILFITSIYPLLIIVYSFYILTSPTCNTCVIQQLRLV